MSHRYYVQSETVRGEPRIHWVHDRETDTRVYEDRNKTRVQARCLALNEAERDRQTRPSSGGGETK